MSNPCLKCVEYQLAMGYLQKDVKRLLDKVKRLEKQLKDRGHDGKCKI